MLNTIFIYNWHVDISESVKDGEEESQSCYSCVFVCCTVKMVILCSK